MENVNRVLIELKEILSDAMITQIDLDLKIKLVCKLNEAINYTRCYKSDSEQLRSSCDWCNGNNKPIDSGTSYADLGK